MKRAFAHIGFSTAVTLLVANLVTTKILIFISIGLAVLFAASLILVRYRKAIVVPLCLGSALLACVLCIFVMSTAAQPQLAMDGQRADVQLYVTDDGGLGDDGRYHYTGVIESLPIDGAPQNIRVRVKSNHKLKVNGYQLINAKVDLYSIGTNALDSYGYWSRDIFLTAKLVTYHPTDDYHNSPMRYVYRVRHSITRRILLMLPDDRGALAVAMLTGDKSHLSQQLLDYFKLSGASHIMAVSGMHLTVVVGMALLLMRALRLGRVQQSVITIAVTLMYMSLAGFSKSVVRAGIMLVILSTGDLIGRRADSLNSLGLAVFVICLNPFAVYDIGAMLSVLSVMSLIVLYPVFARKLPKLSNMDSDAVKIGDRIKSILLQSLSGIYVSISVLIFTLPVMCLFFGYVSFSGIVANVFVVPAAGIMMPMALITYLVSLQPVNIITAIIARALSMVSGFVIKVVSLLATTGNSMFSGGRAFCIFIAGVLIVFAFALMLRSPVALRFAAVVCVAMVIVLSGISAVYNEDSSHVYISPTGAVVISDRDAVVVWGVTDRSSYYSVYDYLTANGRSIDFLVINGDSQYATALMSRVSTDTVLMSEFDDRVLSHNYYRDIQVADAYSVRLCPHIVLHYTNYGCVADVNGFRVGTADSDVTITNDIVHDPKGTIYLNEGSIEYDIIDEDTYGVRRLRQWQD
ncbi:MAG: ComEC/Rec2 family competence protein [Eubacterium sp.]